MATPNGTLIERFYAAFGERDGAAMEACYAPDVSFSDPVFQDLHGAEAGAMWRMLTERADDLRIELLEHEADGERGTAHWMRALHVLADRPPGHERHPGVVSIRRTG